MNIFVLDSDIELCARYHVDKHVVKMITEHAQLLSTAVRTSGIDAGYKVTHVNHPSNIWARESLSNWKWLQRLTKALNDEYRFRYGKDVDHKAYLMAISLPEPNIQDIGMTPFRPAMPDEFLSVDVVEAYRAYYRSGKRHIAKWTNRDVPEWYA